MLLPEAPKRSGARGQTPAPPGPKRGSRLSGATLGALLLVCLMTLAWTVAGLGQEAPDDEGYDFDRRGLDQLDRINEALHRYGRIFLWVGAALLGIVILKIISPFRIYHSTNERLLRRAVRGVGELLKRIEDEAATASPDPPEEAPEEGVLAGMVEIAEFAKNEEVPSYVLTVNDLMLDNIRITLKRLRRFKEGHAPRYRNYMFSVLKGIKIITEESRAANVPSSLAVDVKEYFQDERRYKAWQKLLSHMKAEGENQEVADSFLLFVRNVKEGKPLAVPAPAAMTDDDTAIAVSPPEPAVPDVLSEQTLPIIQQAAVQEAKDLVAFVQTGKPPDETGAWQFELVRRQQHLHQREEAQKMLVVFLSCQRKVWPQITKSRMLPCRTWQQVLYLLGVKEAASLRKRVEDKQLTVQEIIVLEKAFLQTFAKRPSLERVYGHGEDAELMIDMHVPQIRRESLVMLRRSHETEPNRFDRATEALNEAETPQHNEAKKLIEHYVNHRHNPPGIK